MLNFFHKSQQQKQNIVTDLTNQSSENSKIVDRNNIKNDSISQGNTVKYPSTCNIKKNYDSSSKAYNKDIKEYIIRNTNNLEENNVIKICKDQSRKSILLTKQTLQIQVNKKNCRTNNTSFIHSSDIKELDTNIIKDKDCLKLKNLSSSSAHDYMHQVADEVNNKKIIDCDYVYTNKHNSILKNPITKIINVTNNSQLSIRTVGVCSDIDVKHNSDIIIEISNQSDITKAINKLKNSVKSNITNNNNNNHINNINQQQRTTQRRSCIKVAQRECQKDNTDEKIQGSPIKTYSYNTFKMISDKSEGVGRGNGNGSGSGDSSSESTSCSGSCSECDSTSSGEPNLPYPGFPEVALKYLTQETRPRNWCLQLITNPWFERVSILVILFNCITLGMYQPCVDDACVTNRCKILQIFDDIIFAFFALEMSIKMVAMGIYGKNTYLADSWNRLDFFIVLAGLLEYVMHVENLNLTAIRTIRVLRPLRAINRIPSMRILVMLLLDTLPMLGNVLLLCFFVFFIFGIVGVQLWEGILRQRCVLQLPPHVVAPKGLPEEFRVRVRINSISFYYEFSKEQDYICSKPEDSGMHLCSNLPPYRVGPLVCNATANPFSMNYPTNKSCVNWNQYYTNCTQLGSNPFQGTISFDNIGLAWVAIFLVISLEGWTDIMYYVQDAHSFWDWIYFVLLIVIGSFFMINLCLVVIATQFSETKKREMERMRQERARYTSTSTLASSTNNSEPTTCYAEIVKYIAHLWRRFKRRLLKKYRLYKYQRQQRKEGLLAKDNLTFSPSRIKSHHPKCPKVIQKSEQQMVTVMVPLNSSSSINSRASNQNLNTSPTLPVSASILGTNNINNNNDINNMNKINNSNNNNHSNSSPENSELSLEITKSSNLKKTYNNNNKDDNSSQKTILLKIPNVVDADQFIHPCTSGFLTPPPTARRRSSVMFNDFVILHTPPTIPEPANDKNVCSSEKMTQAGDGNIGNIWQVNLPQTIGTNSIANNFTDCSELAFNDTLTCQELLAFSVAFSAALPTGPSTLESFCSSLIARADPHINQNLDRTNVIRSTAIGTTQSPTIAGGAMVTTSNTTNNCIEDYSCCYDLYQNALSPIKGTNKKHHSKIIQNIIMVYKIISKSCSFIRHYVKILVEHKYFQQGILLAILINTLSMGIEYHNQPEELTAIVETSNIVFSAIFAVEMLLKVVAEGPFRYIANGFNVFDGIIVILSAIELCQEFLAEGGGRGNSGLSVLRTFRLLRILKLVRFMPNLRRQLFVMLRTMDNVAVFFSLLVLFIFIFSILGMYLFGGKFCKFMDEFGQERECTCPEIVNKHPLCECDRKHFNNILWATVTVFQILTQEDWNVVLFNGMEKTSHWAALYFVALMTFGNYVLFNLLVAILVEGFSSERNERREREQRELVKKLREETMNVENFSDVIFDESRSASDSSSTNESYYDMKNKWYSAEELRKLNELNDPKCNIQKERLLQPHHYDARLTDSNTLDISTSLVKNSFDRDRDHLKDDETKITKKSHPVKDKKQYEISKVPKTRITKQPPIIMTTAATPQDSPSTTIDGQTTFRNWSQQTLSVHPYDEVTEEVKAQKSHSSPSLLKPPSLINGQKILDERIPSITVSHSQSSSPDTPIGQQLIPKPINLLRSKAKSNISAVDSTTPLTSEQCNKNQVIKIDNVEEQRIQQHQSSEITEPIITSTLPSPSPITKNQQSHSISSLRHFSHSSSFRKKRHSTISGDSGSEEVTILNNDPVSSQLSRSNSIARGDSIRSVNRIQNATKDTNKLSPQNSERRRSSIASRRRQSLFYNNTQLYQNLDRKNSIKNHSSRHHHHHHHHEQQHHLSSMELALEKASHFHPHNIENLKTTTSLKDSKIDDEKKWQKSINESINLIDQQQQQRRSQSSARSSQQTEHVSKLKIFLTRIKPKHFTDERQEYSLYLFPKENKFRYACTWLVNQKWFDNVVLLFIALNCITLAMERPNIPPYSTERKFLATANYVFTVVFTIEMFVKVVAAGMLYGPDAYFTSGWNIMDGSLVIISIIDLLMSLISESSPRIFGILRVFRLLRSLRPLRVINRAPGLKLVVQTLLSSLRPIGNIVLICCTFFIIFGILGVQLFKGTFYYCEGENIKGVRNKTDCLSIPGNVWVNRKYNFDDLGKALMSLFVLSSRDGWVNIMYTGLDAVGVDQQPIVNYNEWRLLYFIAFILLVGFFVLNMFVGVVVENFHRCREEQEKEEKIRRAAKRALQMEKKRRRMHEPPYYTNYSVTRMFVHNVVTSKYFDLAIAAVIGLNVVTMAMEYYMMPVALEYALKIFNYFFTAVFILEAIMKLVALGIKLYLKDKWNQLDVCIVILSIVGIVLEELETNIIPINPTIMRVMRVLRIARVLKLLKMAKGIRALLDTVMQALPQVGNLGLLFFLLFFIFAALGVELFGRLECSDEIPCQGLGEHAHFANFGMAFLTLFRVATGDNWNGIMKDTLRDDCDDAADCVKNCCVSTVIAPIFFVIFVLMAQFVLVNVVVAVLMKHLEESHKQMEDELDMDVELERELVREQEFEEEQAMCLQLQEECSKLQKKPLEKVSSLPSDFTYSTPSLDKKILAQRRQTIQYFNQSLRLSDFSSCSLRPSLFYPENCSISEEVNQDEFKSKENITQRRRASTADIRFQAPRSTRVQRKSIFKPRVLSKERSLDEQSIRRRRSDTKISCDSLLWNSEGRETIFESTENDTNQDVDNQNTPNKESNTIEIELTKNLREKEKSLSAEMTITTNETKHHHQKPFIKSASTDQGGKPTSFLSVPRSMPPRSRSSSTKQLFKQQALDEDPDIDESSLLLPVSTKPQIVSSKESYSSTSTEKQQEETNKSDSAEILRIISERRRIDKKDNTGNESSDYNELLLVKSLQSSLEI